MSGAACPAREARPPSLGRTLSQQTGRCSPRTPLPQGVTHQGSRLRKFYYITGFFSRKSRPAPPCPRQNCCVEWVTGTALFASPGPRSWHGERPLSEAWAPGSEASSWPGLPPAAAQGSDLVAPRLPGVRLAATQPLLPAHLPAPRDRTPAGLLIFSGPWFPPAAVQPWKAKPQALQKVVPKQSWAVQTPIGVTAHVPLHGRVNAQRWWTAPGAPRQ